jgi:hypothetical protein
MTRMPSWPTLKYQSGPVLYIWSFGETVLSISAFR